MSAEDKEMSFEKAIARLEEVVRELEDGRLPLDRALELYAEGVNLSIVCSGHLEAAEQRIYLLTSDEKGRLSLKETGESLQGGGR